MAWTRLEDHFLLQPLYKYMVFRFHGGPLVPGVHTSRDIASRACELLASPSPQTRFWLWMSHFPSLGVYLGLLRGLLGATWSACEV